MNGRTKSVTCQLVDTSLQRVCNVPAPRRPPPASTAPLPAACRNAGWSPRTSAATPAPPRWATRRQGWSARGRRCRGYGTSRHGPQIISIDRWGREFRAVHTSRLIYQRPFRCPCRLQRTRGGSIGSRYVASRCPTQPTLLANSPGQTRFRESVALLSIGNRRP